MNEEWVWLTFVTSRKVYPAYVIKVLTLLIPWAMILSTKISRFQTNYYFMKNHYI